MTAWLYPGDSPVVTARRVAWAYRQRLDQIAPGDCAQLDEVMRNLGQTWVTPHLIPTDPDAWITTAQAAELAAVGRDRIGVLRRTGRLTGRQRSARQWEYRVRDILNLATSPRTRTRRTQTGQTPPVTDPTR
jgi:hypothetical protein